MFALISCMVAKPVCVSAPKKNKKKRKDLDNLDKLMPNINYVNKCK